MELDYSQIGKRIAARRKELGLKQAEVCEKAGINDKYLSCIERATSIPSLEVVMRLALALETTPDSFLVGSIRHENEAWQDTAELLRNMSSRKLNLAKSFLICPLPYQHTPSLPQKQYAGCIPRQQNFFHSSLITPLKNPQPRPFKALSCGFIYFSLVTPYLSECTLQNTVV